MPPASFPDPGPDDPDDDQSPEQGLYVTLPAEQLTLSGFNQGGAADTMAPGALLAAVAEFARRAGTGVEGEFAARGTRAAGPANVTWPRYAKS